MLYVQILKNTQVECSNCTKSVLRMAGSTHGSVSALEFKARSSPPNLLEAGLHCVLAPFLEELRFGGTGLVRIYSIPELVSPFQHGNSG